jgi:tartrate dehydrogenase/decarboxylase/D-malate dehydrogenase
VKKTELKADMEKVGYVFFTDPGRFGIIATPNLLGDIITDLGAALTGGMRLAAGAANINPEGKYPSIV